MATDTDINPKQAINVAGPMMLKMTTHARARLQQRGISESVVEKLFEFGMEIHDHRGCLVVYFNRRARENLRRAYGKDFYKRIEPHLDAYAVVSMNGDIVTVGHRTRHLVRH